ncbi:AT-rich interactive domain-containing protein 3A isoform X1 [Girardinichthys multiradiatus]|uniref:AT-rich interactive domain-containing protein 3A isoform X1 n=1 Tax=Girardinichthys multiradiatus TaxID=208333 RepID=UPI001FADA3C5|nr:AT-rich interactive domain-containing protein 3A isoform X1 [Girardinichthys multiradiatus]XP_047231210.1 AT-rich interactive domain-containing protein 3A isoform X1 [Girardinichthys multiradiatus]XP_047231211.1 AT-rich interactive domain-containing protein 3A isoform X1 [Girardinichthys multiradiatus]
MKLQAVMENLHRQQRAKLLMEQQLQQQAINQHAQVRTGDDPMESPAPEGEHAQIAALAAMRAAAAGLQKVSDSPMSKRSSGGEEEREDDNDEGEEHYKDMMGSDEEEQIKQKWDEGDFESDMDEDFDDDMAEEGLPTGHDAITPGKGILLLPHRQLHPHSHLLKVRPSVEQEPRVAILPPHTLHSHLGGQDHGEWTYEEQFRQLYELDGDPKRKEFLDDLFSFMQKRGTPVNRIPIMAKQVLDLYMLYRLVTEKGGLVEVINKKLWREITKGLNLPTSITSAAFTLRTQYMKYLYPYECDKRGLSNPNELQAAIDSNRREGRRQSFGSSLFTYSPNGTPTMLSSSKVSTPSVGLTVGTNGASMTSMQKIKKEEEGGQLLPGVGIPRLPVGHLPGHSAAAVQAAAAQAAMAAQLAALEQLRDKLEAGEPPEKKMALPAEEHHRLLQRALQHNLLAMTAQIPMNIRINNQDGRQESALNLTTNGTNSISMSVELNGVVYTGVLFAQAAAGSASSGASVSSLSNKPVSIRNAQQQQQQNTPTSASSNPLS